MLINDGGGGPLFDEAGGADGGGGAPADAGALAVADTGTAVTATDDGAVAEPATDPGAGALSPFDGHGNITSSFSEHLKTIDPKVKGIMLRGLGIQSAVTKELGKNWRDTVRTIKAENQVLKQTLMRLGDTQDLDQAIDIISEVLESTDTLDKLFAAGDPKALAAMTETPEGKVGFQRLMPHAMALWEQMNPQAFASHIAGRVIADMRTPQKLKDSRGNEHNVRLAWDMEDLARHTPAELMDGDKRVPNPAVAILAKINAWLEKYAALEQATPEPPKLPEPVKSDDALNQREQDLNTREARLKAGQWFAVADAGKHQIYDKAVREILGKTPGAGVLDAVQAAVALHLPIAVKADPLHSTLRGYWDSGDREGYSRAVRVMHERHIPRLVKKYGLPLVGKTAARVAAPGAPAGTGPAAAGFIKVNARPDRNTIDLNRHRAEDPGGKMLEQHKYFVKGQTQPVQWVQK
jgi:hypothetical protein